jgi:hypothetical protein
MFWPSMSTGCALSDDRPRTDGLQIVAIERDVERARGDVDLFALAMVDTILRRELNAAALNADDDEILGAVVELDDLIGHAPERSIERAGERRAPWRLFWGRGHGGAIWASNRHEW